PGGHEALDLEVVALDDVDAVGGHVGHEEGGAVRREADVLGHAPRAGKLEDAEDAVGGRFDLDELAGELAGGDEVAAVGGEVGVVHAFAGDRDRRPQGHGDRVAKVDPFPRLGHHHGGAAVRGEVEVVRV